MVKYSYLEILIYLTNYIQYHFYLRELEHERERQEIFQIKTIYKKLSIIPISIIILYYFDVCLLINLDISSKLRNIKHMDI